MGVPVLTAETSLTWFLHLLSKGSRALLLKETISKTDLSLRLSHHRSGACWEGPKPSSPLGTGLHALGLPLAGQVAGSSGD